MTIDIAYFDQSKILQLRGVIYLRIYDELVDDVNCSKKQAIIK